MIIVCTIFVCTDAFLSMEVGQRQAQSYKSYPNRVNHEGASILQLATPTNVIIVDFVALNSIRRRKKHKDTNDNIQQVLCKMFHEFWVSIS